MRVDIIELHKYVDISVNHNFHIRRPSTYYGDHIHFKANDGLLNYLVREMQTFKVGLCCVSNMQATTEGGYGNIL